MHDARDGREVVVSDRIGTFVRRRNKFVRVRQELKPNGIVGFVY